jgi:hypothetical protein
MCLGKLCLFMDQKSDLLMKKFLPMKKFILSLTTLLCFCCFNFVNAQCTSSGQYPSTTYEFSAADVWGHLSTCNYAGEYYLVSVTEGNTYDFSTCSDDGATCSYDSQLTLRDSAGAELAYNDDFCGSQSRMTWTASYTGIAQVHVSQYNCASNSTCTTVKMMMTEPAVAVACDDPAACNFDAL